MSDEANAANETQAFHQGANLVAVIAIYTLWYSDVISGGFAFFLMVALVGFYTYRYG